jgi:hypothetical protein
MIYNDFFKKRMIDIILLFSMSIFVCGCSTYSPKSYKTSSENGMSLTLPNGIGVHVDSFESTVSNSRLCRFAAYIAPPDNVSFERYIQMALADELRASGMLDNSSQIVSLKGVIEDLDFSSAARGEYKNGEWRIKLKLISSNGNSLTVSDQYKFESHLAGGTACKRTAEAFLPAVQKIIGKLIKDQRFAALLN